MTPTNHSLSYPARYNDGVQATTSQVTVTITSTHLLVLDTDGTQIASWRLDGVHLVAPVAKDASPRLVHGTEPARLTLDNADALQLLREKCPNLSRHNKTSVSEGRYIIGWGTAAITVILVLLFVVVPMGAAWFAPRIPTGLEARLGRQTADQVIAIFARLQGRETDGFVCTGAPGTATLARVTQSLSTGTHIPVVVTVLDHPLVNAFALPGGQVILFRGLIDAVDDPNLVVGVLAHEIGHVQHRHPTETTLKTAAGVGLVGLVVGDFAGATAIAATAQALLSSSYSREAELEADQAAIAILNRQNIAVGPMAAFFEDRAQQPFFATTEYFSSHPADARGAESFRTHGTGTASAMSDVDWRALQQICG